MAKQKPNILLILVDDLRFDEFGAGGHPYMKTPHIDRIAHEGALFERAFHTTPICSPNRDPILTGQYACRHGIIDTVARDAASHRLPNYHLALQKLGYETAHVGKWHMGNDGRPRPGYDQWVSFDGHGRLNDPTLNVNGRYEEHPGYMTDVLNGFALDFVSRKHERPWALFFAHKAVHPDAFQHPDGTLDLAQRGGYRVAERHRGLYEGCVFPRKPNMRSPVEVVKDKPAWTEAMALKQSDAAKAILDTIRPGSQEEIRLRGGMTAAGGGRGGTRASARASRPWSDPARSTTRSSSSSATTGTSSGSTGSGRSAGSPTRRVSDLPASCASRGGSRPGPPSASW